MHKQFVTYEIAKKLKELGFDELCFCYYHFEDTTMPSYPDNDWVQNSELHSGHIANPLWQQAIDWLDKKHKIRICLSTAKTSGKYRYDIMQFIDDKWQGDYNLSSFYTSEERNTKALTEALELVETK